MSSTIKEDSDNFWINFPFIYRIREMLYMLNDHFNETIYDGTNNDRVDCFDIGYLKESGFTNFTNFNYDWTFYDVPIALTIQAKDSYIIT